MLFGLAAFVGLDWSRFPAWLAALAAGAVGFARAWAWRSAASRARCAPRRCWPSCSRCRSRSWRSCRPARCAPALYDVINFVSGAVPVQAGARALDAAHQRRRLLCDRPARSTWLGARALGVRRASRARRPAAVPAT